MIVPASVDVKHRQAEPFLREVAERVRPVIVRHLEQTGYAFIARIKNVESLAEKLETGRYKRWSDVDDLYACAIIVPTLTDEQRILAFLRSTFREITTKRRGTSFKDPSTFRFDSTRFIGTLHPTLSPEPADALSRQQFEIQVRTAFEHAWAVATHNLVYKGGHVEWRRLRLIAQLKAATEQLDHLIIGFERVAELIAEEQWPEVDAKKSIEERFRFWIENGAIPADCTPASWVRFAENFYAMLRGLNGGKRNLDKKQVDGAIEIVSAALAAQSGERFPRSLSLLQFGLGALASTGDNIKLTNYCPLVTDALTSIFPSTLKIKEIFDLELPGA